MNACKVLELATYEKIDELIELAKTEIKELYIKQKCGITELNRFKKIVKYLKNIYRENFQKTWIEEKYQCFSNGYTGFLLKNHIEELPISEEIPTELLKCIPKNADEFMKIKPDLADIKAKIKIHKALKTKQPCTYDINKSRYNAQYILDCYEILGGENIIFKQPPNGSLNPSIFESENGTAILLPCRKPNVEGEKVS